MPDDNSNLCPRCGGETAGSDIAGNCPACLLGSARMPTPDPEEKRESIAGWDLIRCLGEGAFGVVFLAEQQDPVYRLAAMKILRPGLGDLDADIRFQAESQALARMEHPDIITVFEAGKTTDGRPFQVMEYIEGESITKFSGGLFLDKKLILFDRICSAVAHAHLKGVIHRDLKPANILVKTSPEDAECGGRIKLLDFGIAKSVGREISDTEMLTANGQLLGTPEYMSPEQAAGDEVDTRSDIYSLGIVLYEMLTGRLPFLLERGNMENVFDYFQAVRRGKPPAPSKAAPAHGISRDLDAIILKSIQSDRELRYSTVNELREDLQRSRECKPVHARSPDRLYLMSRFVRRHWKGISVTALIAVVILSAAIFSVSMEKRATVSEHETKVAYSRADFSRASETLGEGKLTEAFHLLARSVRTDPQNSDANRLLRGVLDHFSIPELKQRKPLSEVNINFGYLRNGDEKVTVTEDGIVILGQNRHRLGGSNHVVVTDEKSPRLAVGNLQGDFSIYDAEAGMELFRFRTGESGKARQITDVAFDSDGKTAFVANSQHAVAAFPIHGSDEQAPRWTHTSGSTTIALALSPNGKTLAVIHAGGSIALLNTETGNPVSKTFRLSSKNRGAAPLSDDEVLIVTEDDVAVCSFTTGEPLRRSEGFKGTVSTFAFSPEKKFVAVATDRECYIWDPLAGRTVKRWPVPGASRLLAFHPENTELACATARGGIEVRDFTSGRIVSLQMREVRNALSLQFTDRGDRIEAVTPDGTLYEFFPGKRDLPERKERTFSSSFAVSSPIFQKTLPEKGWEYAGLKNGLISIRDRTTGKVVHEIQAAEPKVRDACISPDGEKIVYRNRHRMAVITPLGGGEENELSLEHPRDITSIDISPDSKLVATGCFDGGVRIWNIESGRAVGAPLFHESFGVPRPLSCSFSADGKWIISWGASDRQVRLWKVHSPDIDRQSLVNSIAPAGEPVAAAKSRDNRLLAIVSESDDGIQQVCLWSTESGNRVYPPIPVDNLEKVTIARDGKSFSVHGDDIEKFIIPDQSPLSPEERDRIDKHAP